MSNPFMAHIYRSDKKDGLYIYLAKNTKTSDLDPELLRLLGKHTLVMELDLNSKQKLAKEDINLVKQQLQEKGYYVQLPQDIVKNVIEYT